MLLISTHRKLRIFFLMLIVICISFFTTAHTNAATAVPVKKVLYLTIDDGPSIYTPQILDILKKYQAKATFFMLEPKVKQFANVVKRIVPEGSQVGCHGVTHSKQKFYSTVKSPLQEMNLCRQAIKQITKQDTSLIRTPYGSHPYLTKAQYGELLKTGYKLWDWNVDSLDWKYQSNPKRVISNILGGIFAAEKRKKTPVIIMHDQKGILTTLPQLLEYARKNGYETRMLTPETPVYNYMR